MRRILAIALLTCCLTGCTVVFDLFGINVLDPGQAGETGSPQLKRFESERELADYFQGQLNARSSMIADIPLPLGDPSFTADGEVFEDTAVGALDDAFDGGTGGAASPDSPQVSPVAGVVEDGARFSDTTTQEVGVDEADVVKTDGERLFILDTQVLRIVDLDTANGLSLIGEIALEGFGREMFLRNDTVVTLTESFGGFFYAFDDVLDGPVAVDIDFADEAVAVSSESVDAGAPPSDRAEIEPAGAVDSGSSPGEAGTGSDAADDASSSDDDPTAEGERPPAAGPDGDFAPEYSRPQTFVTIIDVSDPASPAVVSKTAIDGTSVSSRMIDGVLHLVIANYQTYYFDVLPLLGRPEFAAPEIDVETILPQFEQTVDGEVVASGALLGWEDVYRPTDPDGFGVVSVVSMDIDQPGAMSAKGIVAEPGLVYSSLEALYLTDTNYDFRGEIRETTDIYKFDYVGGETVPSATGTVRGRVLNQYSMGEYQGDLRVATTVGATFSASGERSGPFNNVYVLRPSEGALEVMGSIEDIAERETIQSVRFAGDRGYLVTFEQIDPLFTLDLADPANPVIVGELKVPGFSTYLVPMDRDHVLAVGQYIPEDGFFFQRGVQLSIFDVSNFADPQLIHNVVIGEDADAWSEALFNPKAFTYFAREGLVALPISIYDRFEFFDDDVFIGDGETAVSEPPDERDELAAAPETEPGEPGSEPVSIDTGESDAGGPNDSDPDISEPTEPAEPIVEPEPFIPGGFDGLIVYRVSVENGFEELGRLSTRFEEAGLFWPGSFTRGVFVEDDVFAVTNLGVKGGPIADLTEPTYELLLAEPTASPIEID